MRDRSGVALVKASLPQSAPLRGGSSPRTRGAKCSRSVFFKPALIATAAAMSVAVLPAGAAQAKTIRHLVSIDRCAPVYADRPISAQNLNVVELSVNCLINRGRAEAGAPPLTRPFSTDANGGLNESTPLYNSALAHAQQSVAAKSWDPNNGLVSHLYLGRRSE